jgi:hypothetical protein
MALAAAWGKENPVRIQIRVYACLFLCLWPLAPPHPLSIFFNLLAGPFLGAVLFPLALLVWIFPLLATLTDPVFSIVSLLLQLTAASVPAFLERLSIPKPLLWIYLLGLNLVWIAVDIRKRRAA